MCRYDAGQGTCGPGVAGMSVRRGGRAYSVHGQARLESGRKAWAECTLNMASVFVTLAVLKFSGWLNAFARCRVERKAYDPGQRVRAGCGGQVGGARRPRMQRAREGSTESECTRRRSAHRTYSPWS